MLKYDDPGRIENVGVENLRGMSEFDPTKRTRAYGNMDRQNYVAEEYYADENHYRNFVIFDNVRVLTTTPPAAAPCEAGSSSFPRLP